MSMQRIVKQYASTIVLFGIVLASGVGLLLVSNLTPSVPDSIGYVLAGQSLAVGQGLTFADALNLSAGPFFHPHAFRMVGSQTANAVFGYPPGYPIILALAILLGGQNAVYYVVPVLGALGILLTYWLGRLLTESRAAALWGALLLSLSPTFWVFSTAPWSEIPSLVCLTAGAASYWLSRAAGESRRPQWHWSLLAATLIGYSFFIRYTNLAILVPALLAFELYTARNGVFRQVWRWVFWFGLGLFAAGTLVYNQVYFGGPLNSIYSTPKLGAYPWPYFSLAYALSPSPINGYSLVGALTTLWQNYYVLLFLAPVGWQALSIRGTLISAGVTVSTLALFSVYAFSPTEINARFILPMLPFLCIAIGTGITRVGAHLPGLAWRWAASSILIGILVLSLATTGTKLRIRNENDATARQNIQSLVAETPMTSVWMSTELNDLILIYGKRSVLNYRQMLRVAAVGGYNSASYQGCLVGTIDRLLAAGIPVYYVYDQSIGGLMDAYYKLVPTISENGVFQVDSVIHSALRENLVACPE